MPQHDRPDAAALVAAAAAGDQRSWDALVDRFGGLVWHVVRAYRLGDADSADVVQTVWLRLVESLARIREPAAVGGWLATTARNESLRVLRRKGREVVDDGTALLDTPADHGDSPESVAERAAVRGVVATALDTLSERCRTLLRALAYSPDSSYVEISTSLGMPMGSIGPTRSRCLEHLRRELGARDVLARGD